MNDYSRDETEFGAFEDPSAGRWCAGGHCYVSAPVAWSMLGGAFGYDGLPDTLRTVGLATVLVEGEPDEDETESDAFEDPYVAIGGFFDKILRKATPKKKLEAKVRADVSAQLRAQGKTSAQVAAANAQLRAAQAKAKVTPKALAKGVATSVKVGLAVASFAVPGGAAIGAPAIGGLVAADKLIAAGQRGVSTAKSTIDTTKKLAAAGHVDSQRGLQLLGMASAARAAKGVAAGVEQKVTAQGHAAYTSFLSARKPVVVKPAPKPATPPPRPVAAAPVRPPVVPLPVPVVVPRPVAVPVAAAGNTRAPRAPVVPAPASARDWLVTDDGRVQRVVRGNAIQVSGRGWYVGQFGLQRVGA